MAFSTEDRNDLIKLYIAAFDRAPDAAGLSFWAGSMQNGTNADLTAVSNAIFGDTSIEEVQNNYPQYLSNGEFLENVYQNVFGRNPDEEGLAFWEGAMDNGLSRGDVVVEMINALDNPGSETDKAVFDNKVAVSDYLVTDLRSNDLDLANSALNNVTAEADSVDAAIADLSGAAGATTYTLTASSDRGTEYTGTASNDTFNAYLEQNPMAGGVSNSLSSADHLDGGAGYDTLNAEVVNEFVGTDGFAGFSDIQPTTASIEDINIESRDEANGVTVDAKNMTGIDQIGSEYSDGDLTIENLTTLDDNGNARNTADITVTMDHTDNFNSDDDASDLTVYFDEDYLLSGQSTTESQANYWLLDEDSEDYANAPLLNIERDGVAFTLDGTEYTVRMGQETAEDSDTWEAYAANLQAAIDQAVADGETALEGLSVTVDNNNTDQTFNDSGVQVSIPAITIIDSQGRNIEPTGFTTPDSATGGFDIFGRFDNIESEQVNDPVAVGVELEKVGREGEGGNLTIGGKSMSETEGRGIEVFNIDVLGEENKPSNLGQITSTNSALDTINIATQEVADQDSYASLTVRGENADQTPTTPFGGTVDMINATEFKGDLTIGNETAASNVNTLNATGGGDVNFTGDINADGSYNYDTANGDDTITITLDTDATDRAGTNFDLDTAGGEDTITMNTMGDSSQQTMRAMDNMDIDAGSGEDTVVINGSGRFTIDAGSSSDMVYINADDTATTGGSTGEWNLGQDSASSTGNFSQLLYKGALTVTFAGFESTVEVDTDENNNFIANQMIINEAIAQAIEDSPELSRLLKVEYGDFNQEMTIKSTVDGENDLAIAVSQPEVVAQNADDNQVEVDSADELGLIAGLGLDSSADQNDIASAITAADTDVWAASNGGSSDATTGVNYSVINMGNGANDLLVLDSNENSSNIITIDQAFGKVSVVNFHDDAPGNGATVGEHAIDFRAFLNDTTDDSDNNNNLSETSVNVTLNSNANGDDFASNSVNMITDMDEDPDNGETFADLTAKDLIDALNGDEAYAGIGQSDPDTVPGDFVGNTMNHIVMVENVNNVGEYKVFHVTSQVEDGQRDVNSDDEYYFDTATELGTMDFGDSINFNLAGNEDFESTYNSLIAGEDVQDPEDPKDPNDPKDPPKTDETITVTSAGSQDAAASDYLFDFEVGTYDYSISNFASGDVLDLPETGQAPTLNNNDFTDGEATVTWNDGQNIVNVTLTGLSNADDEALLFMNSFDTVYGDGTIA